MAFSNSLLGRKPFPMAFKDNFACAIDHFAGGLIVKCLFFYESLTLLPTSF